MKDSQPLNDPDLEDDYLKRCAEALKIVEGLGNTFMANNIRAAMAEHRRRQQ